LRFRLPDSRGLISLDAVRMLQEVVGLRRLLDVGAVVVAGNLGRDVLDGLDGPVLGQSKTWDGYYDFFAQNKIVQNLIITMVFEKNAKFLTENCRK
jgi:hypothetical protein